MDKVYTKAFSHKGRGKSIAAPEETMTGRLFSDTDSTPEELQRHILTTYINIRVGIAAIGIAFPFLLWLGGYFYARLPLQGSMSAYYHAVGNEDRSMRD